MAIEVNYDGMAALKGASDDQRGAFAKMETFYASNCSAAKFESIAVLFLFSPIYKDAATEVVQGLSKATTAAGEWRDNIGDAVLQYQKDEVKSSATLKGTWKSQNAYQPPAPVLPEGAPLPYNSNVRSGAQWSVLGPDGAMERVWKGNPLDTDLPGPKFIGGRGGFSDVVGAYYDGKDAINKANSFGNSVTQGKQYGAYESGQGIDGNTPTFANRVPGAINLFDVESALTPVAGMDTGPLIEELKGELGGIIGGINWVLEKIGFNLMDKLLAPVAGSFSQADAVRGNLDRMGSCSRAIGVNYSEIAGAIDSSWRGDAASAANRTFTKASTACERQGDGLTLMGSQVGNFMTATFEGVKLVVGIIGMLVDEIVSVPIAKILGWILTGAAKIKKWIGWIKKAIDLINKLKDIIPPLLVAARAFSRMAIAFKLLMGVLAVGGNAVAGSNVDNTADAAY